MGDITVEKKMQLVQQVRSQYNRNQYDLMNREKILYGYTSPNRMRSEETAGFEMDTDIPADISTFKLRFLAAVILFVTVATLDLTGSSLFGITPSKIYECISQDFDTDSLDFARELSVLMQE